MISKKEERELEEDLHDNDFDDDDNYDDDDDDEDDDDDKDDEDEEEEEDGENQIFHPITNPNISLNSLSEALEYDLKSANFDIMKYLDGDEDTFFERGIVLINKCRDVVQKHDSSLEDNQVLGQKIHECIQDSKGKNEDDEMEFFKPRLEDDAFLLNLEDLYQLFQDQKQQLNFNNGEEKRNSLSKNSDMLKEESNESLKMRIASLENQLQLAKECILKLTPNTKEEEKKSINQRKYRKQIDSDTPYFSSYSHYSIHETMLKDYVRTFGYENAILNNHTIASTIDSTDAQNIFQNKVVMDVGCGTGILSLFAAKAGAKKVYALDGSQSMVQSAQSNIFENGFDNVIEVIHCKVEDWKLPNDEKKIDIIISEWMGYALLFESMLPSVIYARDTFMETGGLVYPDIARIYIEGASDDRLQFWDDVHGIKMPNMKQKVEQELTTEASVEIVPVDDITTNRCELISFDMNTVKNIDLDFQTTFTLKYGNERKKKVDKLVLSFDIDFNFKELKSKVSFSTGCQTKPTHWKQTTLWLDSIVAPVLEENDEMVGSFTMKRNKENERGYDFNVKWEVRDTVEGNIKSDGSIKSTMMP